jgi:hypothetical protein
MCAGGLEDSVVEGPRLALMITYRDLNNQNPVPISPAYEQQADPVIELRSERVGVRLAWLLNEPPGINTPFPRQVDCSPLGIEVLWWDGSL